MYIFLCSLAMPDMLVSVFSALETLMIPVVNSDYRTFKDQFIWHMDNVFDSMICLSLVAPSATSWPLRSTGTSPSSTRSATTAS